MDKEDDGSSDGHKQLQLSEYEHTKQKIIAENRALLDKIRAESGFVEFAELKAKDKKKRKNVKRSDQPLVASEQMYMRMTSHTRYKQLTRMSLKI